MKQRKDKCSRIKNRMFLALSKRFGLEADWVQNHIATCPRCQKRLAGLSRVDVAMALLKNQPHALDLLSKANQKTVAVLKHSLRYSSKAEELKTAVPLPTIFEKLSKYRSAVANIAACVAILFLMKTGIFSSFERFQNDGRNALKHYYADRIGQDITDEIFSS